MLPSGKIHLFSFMLLDKSNQHIIKKLQYILHINRCSSYNAWQYPCLPLLFDSKTPKCSPNGRSNPVCNKQAYLTPRQQLNELSAFIDGSQIYSNNLGQYSKLKEMKRMFL